MNLPHYILSHSQYTYTLSSFFTRLVAPNKKSFYCKIPKWIFWSVIEIIKNEIYGFGQVIVFFISKGVLLSCFPISHPKRYISGVKTLYNGSSTV